MSLILDALNRSREDQGEVPGIGAAHAAPQTPRSSLLVWLLVAALAVALGAILWLLFGRDTATAPQPAAPAAPAQVSAPPQDAGLEPATEAATPAAPAPLPQPVATRQAPPEAEPAASSEAPPEPVADPEVSALYAGETSAEPAAGPAEAVVEKAAGQPQSREQAPPAEVDETVDINAMVRRAESELENARLAEHPAPFIAELSQQQKDAIPTLLYSAHDYSGRSGQSSVLINGERLRKGGSPAPGVTVQEILPDSVVLSYRGTQFRLRALNSWVNL